MKFSTLCKLVALAAIVLGLPGISAANHIDFFADGAFNLISAGIPVSGSQNGAPANILGTEREVSLSLVGGSGFIAAALNPPSPLLSVNSVASLNELVLTYDGVGGAGLGGLDFTANLWTNITVDMSAVIGTALLTVEVTDSLANTGSATGNVLSAGTYSFPYSNAGYSGVDFTSVDSVVVTLRTTSAASDFAMSRITREVGPGDHNIPEPATMIMTLVAAAGSLGFARRGRA
jgi:hypothetical protein